MQWKKISEQRYEFRVQELAVATMKLDIASSNRLAVITAGNTLYSIQQKGFWNTSLEIVSNAKVIGTVKPEKWYASKFTLELEGETYQLGVRNNPLAEWVITKNSAPVLSYGLDTAGGELNIRITEREQHHPVLHYLLWYLFLPVAAESFGNDYVFQSLLLNQ